MKLSKPEFDAMQSRTRRWLQRYWEYPIFREMGLDTLGKDVLEIGCGSGYGAQLLYRQAPRAYDGIDLMQEQVALAQKVQLANATFRVQDAADLSIFADGSKDVVVIFGVLHHIPEWRKVLAECKRVLRPGGMFFNDEPDGTFLKAWDRLIHWEHPSEAYLLREFEMEMGTLGFRILHKRFLFGFGFYAAQKENMPFSL
jgi:ubiquinone/menaquinone biosynthesis C-methylase UbiE